MPHHISPTRTRTTRTGIMAPPKVCMAEITTELGRGGEGKDSQNVSLLPSAERAAKLGRGS